MLGRRCILSHTKEGRYQGSASVDLFEGHNKETKKEKKEERKSKGEGEKMEKIRRLLANYICESFSQSFSETWFGKYLSCYSPPQPLLCELLAGV